MDDKQMDRLCVIWLRELVIEIELIFFWITRKEVVELGSV